MKKLKLSACWIVRNEERDLGLSIESVKNAVDELIVVDTGSTDGTIELARSFGAKVFEQPWADDFSAPRNFAIEHAIGNWIVFLDADEYFAYPKKVRKAIEKFAIKDAIMIPRINIDVENDNREITRDWNPRIFRRAPNLRYRGLIHENITNLVGELKYVFADDRLMTYHTGYSSARIESKLRRNLAMIEIEMKRYGHQPRHDIALVDCFFGLKEYDKSIEHAKLALASNQMTVGRGNIYHKLLDSMRMLNYPDEEQLSIINKAIKELPQLPELYAERGMILSGLGRLDEAYLDFHKSLDVWKKMSTDVHSSSYFAGAIGTVYARLAEFELLVGNIAEARNDLKKAIEHEPGNRDYRQRLLQLKE